MADLVVHPFSWNYGSITSIQPKSSNIISVTRGENLYLQSKQHDLIYKFYSIYPLINKSVYQSFMYVFPFLKSILVLNLFHP
jgi:hypothetical protein